MYMYVCVCAIMHMYVFSCVSETGYVHKCVGVRVCVCNHIHASNGAFVSSL
jgi:hypothetical protein